MRVLRASHYSNGNVDTPTMGIVRDGDTSDTLDSIRHSTRLPGSLILSEIFEAPDATTLEAAIMLAGEQSKERRATERNQAILFFCAVRDVADLPADKSAAYPGPCPLTRDQVIEVLEQVAIHPAYRGQKFGCPDQDGNMIVLQDGKVR